MRHLDGAQLYGCEGAYSTLVPGTLWQNNTRTTAITATTQTVGAWDDYSGKGRNALQSSVGKRPQYLTVSGAPAIQTDGVDDILLTSAYSFGTPYIEIWAVASIIGTADSPWLSFRSGGVAGTAALGSDVTRRPYSFAQGNGGMTQVIGLSTTTGMRVFRATVDFTLSTNETVIYYDGALPPASVTRPSNANNTSVFGSNPLGFGGRGDNAFYNSVAFFAAYVYSRILDDYEAVALYRSLKNQWGAA